MLYVLEFIAFDCVLVVFESECAKFKSEFSKFMALIFLCKQQNHRQSENYRTLGVLPGRR